MTKDKTKLKTNFTGNNSLEAEIISDIGVGIAAETIVEEALRSSVNPSRKNIVGNVYRSGKSMAKGSGKIGAKIVGKKTSTVISKELTEKIANNIVRKMQQRIAKTLSKQFSKMMLKSGLKQGAKFAGSMATKYSAMTAAAAAGPVGVAAGMAATAMMLTFDVVNIVMSILDTKGYEILWDKEYIEDIGHIYDEALQGAFTNAGFPDYFNEEVLFRPEDFVFRIDYETQEIYMDDYYGSKYNAYVDEYMKKVGVEDGWRYRMESINDSKIPNFGNLHKNKSEKQNKNKMFFIILIISILIILIILLNFTLV